MRVPWLADVLRGAGQKVYEMPGWKGRGRDLRRVQGVVWHHTATGPNWNDDHVAFLLRDGRRDLNGPLSQLGLERDGTWVLIADGRANHNGFGEWGNDSIGVEAYNSGLGEPWPKAQLDAYHDGTAAILAHLGLGADRVKGHKETDPRRKIDPAGIDMHAVRRRLAVRPPPLPVPPPAESALLPQEGAVFLIVDNVGFFAVVDGVPVGLTMAQYAKAKGRSPGTPVLHLPEGPGQHLFGYLMQKTAAAVG